MVARCTLSEKCRSNSQTYFYIYMHINIKVFCGILYLAVSFLISDYNNVTKFLNRILAIEVSIQNMLFMLFTDALNSHISREKRRGALDVGILGMVIASSSISKLCTYCLLYRCDNCHWLVLCGFYRSFSLAILSRLCQFHPSAVGPN